MDMKWARYKNILTADCEFRFDSGWDILVEDVLFHMKSYLATKPALSQICKVHCIKEKFGTLRVYCTKTDEYLNGVIRHAEHVSEHICEYCGSQEGKLRKAGCAKVVCKACLPKYETSQS